jgi:hypothetical protein
MVQGRKVRPEEAASLLREWEASGESMTRWCGARGLNWYSLSAFKGWRAATELSFAEVVLPAAPAPTAARYRVAVSGVTIEVGDDFQTETLQRLVRAVLSC